MRMPVPRPPGGDGPNRLGAVDLLPDHSSDLTEALAGDQAKLENVTTVPGDGRLLIIKIIPDGANFIAREHAFALARLERLFHAKAGILLDQAVRDRPVEHLAHDLEGAAGADGDAT